ANILDRAKQHSITTFVVGPTPAQDHETNQHLAQLNEAYQGVAVRRDVLYVAAFTDLVNHQNFNQDVMVNEGLPGQAAYGLIALLVLNRGWFEWLGIGDPSLGSESADKTIARAHQLSRKRSSVHLNAPRSRKRLGQSLSQLNAASLRGWTARRTVMVIFCRTHSTKGASR